MINNSRILRLFVLCSILAVLPPHGAFAVTVEDLYVAEVYVTSQNQKQLKSGARAGLLQVLVRISGSNDILQNGIIANALRNPELYYYQYSYQATDKEFQVGEQVVAARILRLSFEPSAIARLLREAEYPVWGSNRPSVLLWLAVSDENGRRILSETDITEIPVALENLSKLRGLPLLYPLLDLEDEAKLSSAEVWGSFLGRIDRASGRYKPDGILSGRIKKLSSNQWTGSWSYKIDERWLDFSNVAFSADELVLGIVDLLVDALADRYAPDSSRNLVELQIENIESIADYARASQYLQSLTLVLDSFVLGVSDDDAYFKLSTEGRLEQLIETIALDEKMILMSQSNDNLNNEPHLRYRWVE